jgi:thiosulfate/3-mercaptopyruvate sulfurtransferase
MSTQFVSAPELAELLDGENPPAVLDASLVLHTAEFDGDYRKDGGRPRWLAGHIPGSHHVDLATQFVDADANYHYAHPEPQAIADELAALGVAKDRDVVIYDTTGSLFAARLWYLLRWIGVDARVLDGGFAAWKAADLPVSEGEDSAPKPVEPWQAEAERRAWISKTELTERAESDERPLVCSLPPAQFAGSAPSRYARRGRIPGSINVSSRDHFTAEGKVKSRVELILAYDAAGVDVTDPAEEVLLYCGGGISAAAGALALAEIGVTAVRVYDGSLEEWAADPSLPLDLG